MKIRKEASFSIEYVPPRSLKASVFTGVTLQFVGDYGAKLSWSLDQAGHRHHNGGELITLEMVEAVRLDVDKLFATLKSMRFEQVGNHAHVYHSVCVECVRLQATD
mgnify:CR=1 FL=1